MLIFLGGEFRRPQAAVCSLLNPSGFGLLETRYSIDCSRFELVQSIKVTLGAEDYFYEHSTLKGVIQRDLSLGDTTGAETSQLPYAMQS